MMGDGATGGMAASVSDEMLEILADLFFDVTDIAELDDELLVQLQTFDE
jgi:hypothetical protein